MQPASGYVEGMLHDDVLVEWYRYPPGPAGVTSRHAHAEYQLSVGVGPPTRYRYRGGWHVVPSRSLSVLMPGEVHETLEMEDRVETGTYHVLYVGDSRLQEVANTALPFFPDAVLGDRDLIKRFQRLHASFDDPASRLGRDVDLLSFLGALVGRHAKGPLEAGTPTAPRRALRVVRDYLDDNSAADISLEDLGELAELSPFHLARLFQQEIGLPPHAYQLHVRLNRAKRLLLRGDPVTQVASETGFYDLSHFTRHFKRHLGVPPGRYVRDG